MEEDPNPPNEEVLLNIRPPNGEGQNRLERESDLIRKEKFCDMYRYSLCPNSKV